MIERSGRTIATYGYASTIRRMTANSDSRLSSQTSRKITGTPLMFQFPRRRDGVSPDRIPLRKENRRVWAAIRSCTSYAPVFPDDLVTFRHQSWEAGILWLDGERSRRRAAPFPLGRAEPGAPCQQQRISLLWTCRTEGIF